jgi:hypothetical protein
MSSVSHVVSRGEALESRRSRFDAPATMGGTPKPPALAAIRYADPAAWIAATAVANAVDPVRERVLEAHDRTGVVAISADGPVEAMAAMCEASRAGSSSPIRFPASNAGSLAGLTSIAFSFRGPTLMLTLPPDRGVPVGLLLAEAWLRRGVCAFVAVVACRRIDGAPVARCLLLGPAGQPLDPAGDVPWLVGA